MRNSHPEPVIVRRNRRQRGAPMREGAWKVAFADFTMALMALFLVLWLLAVSERHELRAVSEALRNYSVLDGGPNPFDIRNSPHLIDFGGRPALIDELTSQVLQKDNKQSSEEERFVDAHHSVGVWGRLESPEQMALLASVIEELARILDAMDNLTVEVVPQGLRIAIHDDQKRQMFARGSDTLEPFFETLLMQLGPVFERVENALILSGHTDTVPYQSQRYTNWELSGDRALMARRVLESGGMPASRVAQVVAFSDRVLADREHPDDSTNRRIEILLLTSQAHRQLFELFDRNMPGNSIEEAHAAAAGNLP